MPDRQYPLLAVFFYKGYEMKRAVFICLLLTACVNVDSRIELIKVNEVLGAGSEHLFGKVFSIVCGGNGYASAIDVKEKCLYDMAEFVYYQGYDYFSVLDQDSQMWQTQGSYTTTTPITTHSNAYAYGTGGYASAFGSSTTYMPVQHNYTITQHGRYYIFIMVTPEEIPQFNNYYLVADYFLPPQAEASEKESNSQEENDK